MLYQPNFCCQCGEKIERIEWKLWTSRRFCENCEKDFRKQEWTPRIGAVIITIFGIFGLGSYLKTPEKSLNLVSNQVTLNSSNKVQSVRKELVSANTNNQNALQNRITVANSNLPAKVEKESLVNTKSNENNFSEKPKLQLPTEEISSYCGAQTKKGTPCTRKVKGGGRCWQHTGLPAILPKEKLIIGKN